MMNDKERAQKLFGNAIYGHAADSNYFSRNRDDQGVVDREMETRSDDWPDVVSEVESLLHLVESVQQHKVPNHKVQADIVREINSLYRLIEQAYDNV
jgi:hypothetical protein